MIDLIPQQEMNKFEQERSTGEDYERIADAIEYLEAHFQDQPTLEELADHLHLSPFYTQRLFKRWAGISPKRFLQFLTLEHARKLLADSHSVLDAALDSGLSGTSRLHDLFVNIEAVTPAEYRRLGEGLAISYGYHATPFGECLLACTERGICGLWFTDTLGRDGTLSELKLKWPGAILHENGAKTGRLVERVFAHVADDGAATDQPLNLLIRGTNFQLQVWQALLKIPAGAVCSYGDIAEMIERPSAVRAVGSAIGKNGMAWLIPCHRVIRKNGEMDNYRWGGVRKKAMLAREWGFSQRH